MKHKHCDLIKAWADGAEIQVRTGTSRWQNASHPNWSPDCEYRIKPRIFEVGRWYPIRHKTNLRVVTFICWDGQSFQREGATMTLDDVQRYHTIGEVLDIKWLDNE